jgi:hypothetical protein
MVRPTWFVVRDHEFVLDRPLDHPLDPAHLGVHAPAAPALLDHLLTDRLELHRAELFSAGPPVGLPEHGKPTFAAVGLTRGSAISTRGGLTLSTPTPTPTPTQARGEVGQRVTPDDHQRVDSRPHVRRQRVPVGDQLSQVGVIDVRFSVPF